MGADREREMRALLAADVETVGVGEPTRIAVRRGQDRPDQRALFQLDTRELGGSRRLAR